MKKLMILTVAILLAGAGTGYAQPQDANSRKMARKQICLLYTSDAADE